MKERNHLPVFIAITFGLSILLSLFIGLTGGQQSGFFRLRFAAMSIPAIAVLIMSNIFKAPPEEIEWNKLPVRWLIPALLFMPVVIHAVCLPLMAVLNDGRLPWQPWLTAKQEGLLIAPGDLGWVH
jgi:hypothetical protein